MRTRARRVYRVGVCSPTGRSSFLSSPLAPLRERSDEFGALARLTESYFAQSEQMQAEIAERIAAQEEVTRSLAQKEILLREIHHRVKNNLQMISSLLTLQSEQMPSPEARDLLTECVHRVRSMAMIHQQLYGVETIDRIELETYVNTLAGSLRLSLAPECRLRVNANPVELSVDLAVPIGLILNELLTNAFKYGSRPDGSCYVRVDVEPLDDGFAFTVSDQGKGLGALEGRKVSMGTTLINALVRQLRARRIVGEGPGTSIRIEVREDGGR